MTHHSFRVGAITLGVLAGGAVAALFSWALQYQSYNVWGAVLIVPILVTINALIIWRVARKSPEPWLGAVLGVGLVAKLVGTFARYGVAYVVYRGAADAQRYNLYAAANYEFFRQGIIEFETAGARGTHNMELITTAIYAVVGPSPLAGFVVYASFAFWGQYLIYRAFRLALPNGDAKRYALLLFLLPTMLYWPSSIGKESWLMLFVGVTALGAARFFARTRGALALLALGAVGTAIVRPHISLLLFAGVAVAQLFRPTGNKSTDILSKVGGLVVLGVATAILVTQSAAMLGVDDLNWQRISESVQFREGQTVQGGSEFAPVPLTSIDGIPMALITILFRPFPWEAHNIQLLVQSLEGFLLLALTLKTWPRIKRVPGFFRTNPYVVFAMVYCAGFVFAFSGFGNFGILARQRVLMIPFFFILLALPRLSERATPRTDRELKRVRA